MLQIQLVPDLDHCIETVARREHGRTVGQLLTSEKGKRKLSENMQKAELLRNFLDTADFTRLRSESEKHLTEGRDVKFLLYLENGVPKFMMQVN